MILLPYLGFRGKLKEWLFRQLVQGNSWKSLDIILHYCIPFSKLLCLNCHPVPFCIQFHWCFTGFDSLLHKAALGCNRYEINSSQCFFCNLRGFQACPPLSSTHLTLCPEERLVHLGLSQQRYRSAKLAHLPFLVNLWEKGIAAQLQSSCEMGHSVGFNCLTGSALLGFFLKWTVVT